MTGKYSSVDPAAVERIYADMSSRYSNRGDIIKAVKKEFHLIYGSFLTKDCHARAETLIRGYRGEDIYADKNFARRLMALHVSTAERAGRVEEIYEMIAGHIRPDDTVVDAGCGFNPFSLPFFRARPKAYAAYDLCGHTVALVNSYFERLGPAYRAQTLDLSERDPEAYRAQTLDLSARNPETDRGVLLMFKLFPLLERRKKGRAFEILTSSGCRAAIVSFPTKSASGRERGMEAYYAELFAKGLPPGLTVAERHVFGNEMFFIVKRDC